MGDRGSRGRHEPARWRPRRQLPARYVWTADFHTVLRDGLCHRVRALRPGEHQAGHAGGRSPPSCSAFSPGYVRLLEGAGGTMPSQSCQRRLAFWSAIPPQPSMPAWRNSVSLPAFPSARIDSSPPIGPAFRFPISRGHRMGCAYFQKLQDWRSFMNIGAVFRKLYTVHQYHELIKGGQPKGYRCSALSWGLASSEWANAHIDSVPRGNASGCSDCGEALVAKLR